MYQTCQNIVLITHEEYEAKKKEYKTIKNFEGTVLEKWRDSLH